MNRQKVIQGMQHIGVPQNQVVHIANTLPSVLTALRGVALTPDSVRAACKTVATVSDETADAYAAHLESLVGWLREHNLIGAYDPAAPVTASTETTDAKPPEVSHPTDKSGTAVNGVTPEPSAEPATDPEPTRKSRKS